MVLHDDFYEARLPVHRQPGDVPEAIPYTDEPISTYESNHGHSFTASKLGFKDTVDHITSIKMHAVDEYIRQTMQDERLRDSQVGYNTVFTRLMEKTGQSFEHMFTSGKSNNALELLFMQVSLVNRVSSRSFLKDRIRQYNIRRVDSLKQQLREGINALKNK